MGGLINSRPDEDIPEGAGVDALVVEGITYRNAAAKFWPSLIDEVLEDYPQCTAIELSAASSGLLRHDHLYPEKVFNEDLEAMMDLDLQQAMTGVVAELKILGPPASVMIRLLQKEEELFCGELPLDCLDAELFPYVISWPLRWAMVPETSWNKEYVSGSFLAQDRTRALLYSVDFNLNSRHLSEGLYHRSFSVASSIGPLQSE